MGMSAMVEAQPPRGKPSPSTSTAAAVAARPLRPPIALNVPLRVTPQPYIALESISSLSQRTIQPIWSQTINAGRRR
jgi:hypothetical protein